MGIQHQFNLSPELRAALLRGPTDQLYDLARQVADDRSDRGRRDRGEDRGLDADLISRGSLENLEPHLEDLIAGGIGDPGDLGINHPDGTIDMPGPHNTNSWGSFSGRTGRGSIRRNPIQTDEGNAGQSSGGGSSGGRSSGGRAPSGGSPPPVGTGARTDRAARQREMDRLRNERQQYVDARDDIQATLNMIDDPDSWDGSGEMEDWHTDDRGWSSETFVKADLEDQLDYYDNLINGLDLQMWRLSLLGRRHDDPNSTYGGSGRPSGSELYRLRTMIQTLGGLIDPRRLGGSSKSIGRPKIRGANDPAPESDRSSSTEWMNHTKFGDLIDPPPDR